jgi:hypothetical protein
MKKILLLSAFTLLNNHLASAQTILGEIFQQDVAHDLKQLKDNAYLVTGTKASNGVLYKVDCAGKVLATLEKSFAHPLVLMESVELTDGNIATIGYIDSPVDSLKELVLLKTDTDLNELALQRYLLSGKAARGRSITLGQDGVLLVYGEIRTPDIDFWDMFFLRVNPFTLLPASTPVSYQNGLDVAQQILHIGNGEYLLSGSGTWGNVFAPEAQIENHLVAIKVNAQGQVIWQYDHVSNFKAKFGLCKSGGAAIHPQTGNILTSGVTYTGNPDSLMDPVFVLLNPQGVALDTFTAPLAGQQTVFEIIPNKGDFAAYLAVGETAETLGYGSLLLLNPKEYLPDPPVFTDPTPVSLRGIVEDQNFNRFALLGVLPDNLLALNLTDIILATPSLSVEVVYQNCALAASFNAPGSPTYQWYRDSVPVPGATAGFYFPSESGVYHVQITDAAGCIGYSDTLAVTLTTANFEATTDGLSVTFTNTSASATSFLWNFGDGQTSTLENPEHTYAAGGSYSVTLIASSQCGADTITQTVGLVSAAEPSWLTQFRLFPNPNAGVFTLEINGEPQDELLFTLFNATGQLVDRQILDFKTGRLQERFDFGDLPPGIYTLQVLAQGEAKYVKVVMK